MNTLKDKVILITGAGRGLGRHLAARLGARGATIAVNDINPDKATATVALVEAAGGRSRSYLADVAKKFPVQALFNAIEDDWGRLDAVVNNARVVPHKPLMDMDEWDWRRTIDVNLTGAFILSQVAGRILRAGGGGTIIQPVQALSDITHASAYLASTRGVAELFSKAAEEFGQAGVHLHAVPYKENDYAQATDTILSLLTHTGD